MIYRQNLELVKNCKVGLVDIGLGDGFDHTNELYMMKYEAEIIEPDSSTQKYELEEEHNK